MLSADLWTCSQCCLHLITLHTDLWISSICNQLLERNGYKRQFCVLCTVAALIWPVDSDLLCVEQAGGSDQRAGRLTNSAE